MTQGAVTVFICVACRQDGDADQRPGQALLDGLSGRLSPCDRRIVAIEAVECLGVCGRPATVALAAEGKWTYVVGDIDADGDLDDLIASARAFAASADGRVPWKERPAAFRKGVVARVPPLPARTAEGE
jgi:predicted metal-binding protein